MIADIKGDFPTGVVGPFFNDRFGDVFGNIYAFTSDGLTQRQLRDLVEDARSKVLTVPNVGKVDVVGAQDEAIYLEFSTRQIAALGIDQQSVIQTLQAQNAVTQSGFVDAGPERIALRVSGQFTSEDSLRSINLRINDRFFPLSDVATIKRGYVDPPSSLFRFDGQPAIGLAIGMKQGANLLEFGEGLDAQMKRVVADLPIGVDVHRVSDQLSRCRRSGVRIYPRAVRSDRHRADHQLHQPWSSLKHGGGDLHSARPGDHLRGDGIFRHFASAHLARRAHHRARAACRRRHDRRRDDGGPSGGGRRSEEGRHPRLYIDRLPDADGNARHRCLSFIPVGLNNSAAGEFTFTLFVVIAVSLIVSWVVAVLFTPLLGVTILPKTMKSHHEKKGRFASIFSWLLGLAMRWRWVTIILTVGVFGLSIGGMGLVQQQFFPNSDRTELVIDWNLPHNSSIAETNRQMARFEKEMLADNKDIDHWTTYVGQGAPRFILSFDVQTPDVSFGQTIIVTKGLDVRDKVRAELQDYLTKTFPGTDAFVKLLDIGPPVGKPVQYRVTGPDIQKVRDLSQQFA